MILIKKQLIAILLLVTTLFMPLFACSGETEELYCYSNTVYVTKTGTKYHRGSCHHLQRSKIEIELEDAKRRGYGPCSACDPPTEKDF